MGTVRGEEFRNAHQTLRQSHTQTTRGALGLLLSHSSFRSSVPTGSNLDLARSGLSLRGGPSLCSLLNESGGFAHGSRLSRVPVIVPVSPFEVVRTSAWRASAASGPRRAAVRVSMQLPVTDARAAPSAHLAKLGGAMRSGPGLPSHPRRRGHQPVVTFPFWGPRATCPANVQLLDRVALSGRLRVGASRSRAGRGVTARSRLHRSPSPLEL